MSRTDLIDPATRKALLFALLAESLAHFYAHAAWLSETQLSALAGQWLSQAKLSLPSAQQRDFARLGDELARELAASLSREAGLYAAHEMMEARDPRYVSPFAQDMLAECERRLAEHTLL